MTVIIIETAMLTVKAEARELIDIMYTILLLLRKSVFIWIGSLMLPVIFPQATVCIVNVHALINWYISTSDIGVVGGSGAAATV